MISRETLGKLVRQVWIEWAKEQPNPKASWLVPWERLSESDREVDRRIGENVAAYVLADTGLADARAELESIKPEWEKFADIIEVLDIGDTDIDPVATIKNLLDDNERMRDALLDIASLDPVVANANQARALVRLVQIAEQALNTDQRNVEQDAQDYAEHFRQSEFLPGNGL